MRRKGQTANKERTPPNPTKHTTQQHKLTQRNKQHKHNGDEKEDTIPTPSHHLSSVCSFWHLLVPFSAAAAARPSIPSSRHDDVGRRSMPTRTPRHAHHPTTLSLTPYHPHTISFLLPAPTPLLPCRRRRLHCLSLPLRRPTVLATHNRRATNRANIRCTSTNPRTGRYD